MPAGRSGVKAPLRSAMVVRANGEKCNLDQKFAPSRNNQNGSHSHAPADFSTEPSGNKIKTENMIVIDRKHNEVLLTVLHSAADHVNVFI